jgi:hypothetical protein
MVTVTDFPDWMSTGQQVSAQIATGTVSGTPGGTPLLTGLVNLLNATASGTGTINVPANSTQFPFIGPGTITRPGYQISIAATMAAATIPFLGVQLFWKDSATGLQVAEEVWYIPVTTAAGGITIYGKGPCKGNELSFGLVNYDPANAITVSLAFWQTTHHISRDDWRSNPANTVPGTTQIPSSDPFALILGTATDTNLAANATVAYLLPLYAGQVEIAIEQTVAQSLIVNVFAVDPSIVGAAFTALPIYVAATAAAKQIGPFPLYFPRCPCILQVQNGANIATVQMTVTNLEYAS